MSRGRHKKQFECGHRGFGKFCNRCKMADTALAKAKRQRKGSAKRNESLLQAAHLKGAGGAPTKADLEALGVEPEEAQLVLDSTRETRRLRELDEC
jgi:hypothetical protein